MPNREIYDRFSSISCSPTHINKLYQELAASKAEVEFQFTRITHARQLLMESKAEVERLQSQLKRAVEIAEGFCGCGCGGDYGLCNFCSDYFSELDQIKSTLNQTNK